MSFSSIAKSIAQGEVPGVSLAFAKTKLNEALKDVYDKTDWSFQSGYSGWLIPTLIATGTVTTTAYSTSVICDASAATAIAAAAALGRPFITERQFRNPSYQLYNIVRYQPNVPSAGLATLTLDRPWMEPAVGAGNAYQIYQALFPVPVQDFTKFVELRDTTNSAKVLFTKYSQDDLSLIDPRRLMFGPSVPTHAVPYGADQRSYVDDNGVTQKSATYGWLMYEVWPHILAQWTISFSYKRSGPLMVNPDDAPPYPITEECVKWRALEMLYQFKESQKGENVERGAGANWQFLSQAAAAEFKEKLHDCRRLDANLHLDFKTHPVTTHEVATDGYSLMRNSGLNVGTYNR